LFFVFFHFVPHFDIHVHKTVLVHKLKDPGQYRRKYQREVYILWVQVFQET